MIQHFNRFSLQSFICIAVLAQTLLAGNVCAQEQGTIRKGVTTVVVGPTISPAETLKTTIMFRPCDGERPDNVLGVSAQTPMPERVAGFTKKLHDPDPKTRACAARQLGYLGSDARAADPDLIRLLHDEENKGVSINVEDALWEIGPGINATAEDLSEMLNDRDIYVRLYAAFALGYYKPQDWEKKRIQTVVSGLTLATKDQDVIVRWLALKGLGRIGPLAKAAVPVLIQFLNDKDPAMRNQATLALSRMGSEAAAAVPALLESLYNQNDYANYIQTAIALGRMGPVILPLLEREIHTNHTLRILKVLEFMGPPGAPLVIQALLIKDSEVRKKAIAVAAMLGPAGEPAVPLLIDNLKDRDENIRFAAASALAGLGAVAKPAVPALTAALADKESGVQFIAALALGAIGPAAKTAVPNLLRLMQRPVGGGSGIPQIYAAEALMKISDESKALVPEEMRKKIADWKTSTSSSLLFAPDETKPKPKAKPDKPVPTKVF